MIEAFFRAACTALPSKTQQGFMFALLDSLSSLSFFDPVLVDP